MIRIKSQDAEHQYDSYGNPITYWHSKMCAWIILPEFETEEIDWWGEDNDFPSGCTYSEYTARNPGWESKPDIHVTWFWNTKEECIKAFGHPRSFGQSFDYWDKQRYPYTANREWGYIESTKEEAIEFGKYCDFHKYASRVIVRHNREIIHDGKLK